MRGLTVIHHRRIPHFFLSWKALGLVYRSVMHHRLGIPSSQRLTGPTTLVVAVDGPVAVWLRVLLRDGLAVLVAKLILGDRQEGPGSVGGEACVVVAGSLDRSRLPLRAVLEESASLAVASATLPFRKVAAGGQVVL